MSSDTGGLKNRFVYCKLLMCVFGGFCYQKGR